MLSFSGISLSSPAFGFTKAKEIFEAVYFLLKLYPGIIKFGIRAFQGIKIKLEL